MPDQSWYRDGLRFECKRCGNCCTGEAGTIAVTESEIETLAAYLGMPLCAFCHIFVRILPDGTASIREKANGDCFFFKDGRECIVYKHRPRQCRTWPFWQSVIRSPECWKAEAEHCAGMDRGKLYSAEEIQKLSENDGTRGARKRK